jgi:cell division protein FtsA
LFGLVQAELRRSGFEDVLGSGIVLTGGSSKMEGMTDLAEEVFHMPVRLGLPQYVGGLKGVVQTPIYATGVGLVLYGAKCQTGRTYTPSAMQASGMKGMMAKMKSWFQGNF